MKSAAFLQLHLPEHWPDPGALDEPRLRWAWSAGGRVEEGVSSLAEIPRADEICLVLPVARVAFVRASLPPGCPAPGPSSGTGSGGFAALGGIEAIALDASLDGRPPLSLKLAADERRRRGDAPQAVRMLLAGSADAPDTGRWAEALHVPVLSSARGCPRRPTRRRPRARTSSRVRAADDGARRTSGRASGRRPS